MKNVSIRTRILAGVVLVNLLGAIVTMVYLHQSYSGGVKVSATDTVKASQAVYEQLSQAMGKPVDPITDPNGAIQLLGRMKAITGADYAYLADKPLVDEQAYRTAREDAGLPDNWSEGEKYAMAAFTDEVAAEKMRFEAPSDSVPEIGKTVGVENGACSQLCHNGMTAEGDYWGVAWSTDSHSRVHAVFPVTDSKGRPAGVIYALEDVSDSANSARSSMLRTLFVIALTLLAATLLIGGLIDSLVFKRLNRMMEDIEDVATRVAGGDFDAQYFPDGSADEIGEFEQFFANVITLFTGTLKSLMNR